MTIDEQEERQLRAVALRNVEAIVSARQHAERALRSSQERFKTVFEQAAVGIAVAGLDGRLQEANHKCCAILGYPLEELRGHTFVDLTHPDDVELTQSQVSALIAGSVDKYSIEKRYIRKNGSTVWSSTTVTMLKAQGSQPAQLIGIIEDITLRKQAEELQSHLAAVVESTDDAVLTKTLDGIILTWNPGAERMFGYCAAEAVGQPVVMLIPDDQRDEEPTILQRLRDGRRIDHYETRRRKKDGTLIDVSLSVSPIKDSFGRIVAASKIARDITRQKRAEAALRETDQRKDEFLAMLAHELRNPLAPIRQAALISSAQGATEAQKRWSHEVVSRQVQHMSLLLDDLLDVSRITRGTLALRIEMTDLAGVVDAAVETARPLIDAKKHDFAIELPAAAVRFAGDPLRLAQVLSNLLTNAAKYTDPAGRIRLRACADAQSVIIVVSDTGVGLSAEAMTAVFTMFSQVKGTQDRSEGGLGIGLGLAKGLIGLHGGTIEARSDGVGRGSEFTVRIPRRTIAASAEQTTASSSPAAAVKRRVLVADDNRDAAESLAVLLEIEGHDVTVVHDGKAALASLRAAPPEVALLDIGMPEMDGYEVARQFRGDPAGRAVTLIAVTGWGQETDKAHALAAGFDFHFTKPMEPERIIALLRSP